MVRYFISVSNEKNSQALALETRAKSLHDGQENLKTILRKIQSAKIGMKRAIGNANKQSAQA